MLKIECSNPKIDWKDWNKEKPTSCLIAVNIICNLLESTFLSFWGWLHPRTQFAILRSICTNGRATHDGCATPTGGRALPMRHPESSHPSCRRDIKVDYASQIVLHLAYFVQPLFEISRFTKDPKVGWTRFSRCFPVFSWSFCFSTKTSEAQQVLDPETEVEVLVMAYHSYVQVRCLVILRIFQNQIVQKWGIQRYTVYSIKE